MNEIYTDIYISSTNDVRKGPNEKCSYAGFIDLKACSQPLQGIKGNYTWREYAQMSECQKCIKSVKELLNFNSETFTYINEVLTGTPGPKGSLIIYKDGGGNHMVGSKGKFEFCWLCLGHYPGYSHSETTYCPLRKSITVLMMILSLVVIDYRMCNLFPILGSIHYYIYFAILYIGIPNLYVLVAFIEIPLIVMGTEGFKPWASPLQRFFGLPIFAGGFIYPILYLYISYKMWQSIWLGFIIKIILFELFIIIGGIAIYLSFVVTNGRIFYILLQFTIKASKLIFMCTFSILYSIGSGLGRRVRR